MSPLYTEGTNKKVLEDGTVVDLVEVNSLPPIPAGTNTIGNVGAVLVTTDADITQLVTVTTAGTPVQGPNKSNPGGWVLKASPTNVVAVRFMFHGQLAAAKGFPLSVGESMYIPVANLSDLDFDADSGGNGSKIWAIKF